MKNYIVTGVQHGSIVCTDSEGAARRIFHKLWNGESIIYLSVAGKVLQDYRLPYEKLSKYKDH